MPPALENPAPPTDAALLHRYAQSRDPAAFQQLAARHINWIYSSALRLTKNSAAAHDVTQGVLLALSQKAATLARHPALIAWLFRATCFAAAAFLRAERRRKLHEAAAMPPNPPSTAPDTDWLDIQPRLDAAIAELSATDRHALLLRYYQQLTHSHIAATMNISEEAARKRIDRALARLRKLLGVKSTAAALSALLATSIITAAPSHLYAAPASVALATSHALAVSKGIHTMLLIAKLKWAAAIALAFLIPISATALVLTHHAPAKTSVAAAPPAAPTPPPTVPSPLTGIVLNEQNQPAPNVLVLTPDITLANGQPGYSARTAPDGRFTLQLPASITYIPALLARTQDELHQVYVAKQNPPPAPADVRLTLTAARQFPISVTNAQHQPLPGATIFVSPNFATGRTDAAGKATLNLPANAPLNYIIALKDNAGCDYQLFREPSELRTDPYRLPSDFTGPLAFTLNGARSVLIRAVDEQGLPLAGASVAPWYIEKPNKGGMANLSFIPPFRQETNAKGIAQFAYIPVDNLDIVTFWVQLAGYTSPERWEWKPSAPKDALVATLQKMIPITGIVHDEQGRPVADAVVYIGGAGSQLDEFKGSPHTNPDGTFSINVDPEKYYVLFAQKDHLVSPALTRIIHHSAPADPFDLKLAPAIHVFGTITAGEDQHPVSHVGYLSLVRRDRTYHDLPPEQKFPASPSRPQADLAVMMGQSATLDPQGNFDFYTIPGDYYLDTYVGTSRIMSNFTLTDETEKEVDLHADSDAPVPAALHGRVVLSDKPGAGVPDISLSTIRTDLDELGEATTLKDGTFELRRLSGDFYLHATSADKSQQALRLLTPADPDHITVTLAPTTTATGRLVDGAGNPLPNRRIDWGIHIGKDQGMFMTLFGSHTTTAPDGTFTLTNLIPNAAYDINLANKLDADGNPASWTSLSKVTPDSAKPVSLGDISLPPKPDPETEPAIP